MTATTTISGESTMAEVLAAYPGAQRALFRRYHIGGCSSCGFAPDERLSQLCARNGGLKVDEVVDHILTSHAEDEKILISPRELQELLANGFTGKLLDIRAREEHDAVRIEGSIPFTEEIMNEILGRWDRNATVIIYDHTGTKSMDAAAYFLGHGFKNVRALRGGIDAWSREVDPKLRRYKFE